MTGARRSTSGTTLGSFAAAPSVKSARATLPAGLWIGAGRIGAENGPGGLARRRAVTTDRTIAADATDLRVGGAAPLVFPPIGPHPPAEALFECAQGLGVELPCLR